MNVLQEFDNSLLSVEHLQPGAMIVRGFAQNYSAYLLAAIETIVTTAPFRQMSTPGGYAMSVAMTNCGSLGWVTDLKGYRYSAHDPLSQQPWPPMPELFKQLAAQAAATAGYTNFIPDSCLMNRYEAGAKMGLHQDKDERDFRAPIVSISLGLPAVFLWGGLKRAIKPRRIILQHGDVAVWGGPARLVYHGIAPLKTGYHAQLGQYRINLTFRKAH